MLEEKKIYTADEINDAIDEVYEKLKEEYKSIGAVFADQLIHKLDIYKQKPHGRYMWKRDDTDDMYID